MKDTGYVHIMAIVNNVAMNIRVEISLWDSVFISLGYVSRSVIAGSYGSCIVNFWRTLHCLHSGYINLQSYEQYTSAIFFIFSPELVIPCLFHESHSKSCEMIVHCGVDLHFPGLMISSSFSCMCCPFVYLFFGNVSIQFLCQLFNKILFLLLNYIRYLYIFGN